MDDGQIEHLHLSHWGVSRLTVTDGNVVDARPWSEDSDPSPIIDNLPAAHRHQIRISQPHVREGWLRHGPGPAARGDDRFVPVSWDRVLDLLAGELHRVYAEHGAEAVYGGSYGWGSAGRFHHAQSQVHRFLKTTGGYVRSVGSYSFGTSSVILPHVIGPADALMSGATDWNTIAGHTERIVAFGGLSPKNAQMGPGGISRRPMRDALDRMVRRGGRIVSVSPIRDDTLADHDPVWIAARPATDTALMLGLAYVLEGEGLVDEAFLDRCTTGYGVFRGYLLGDADGTAKTPEWAARITGIDAAAIRALALEMAGHRTLITLSWSLQRAEHGEQPLWMGIVLAAMLGQIGLPGGGFGHGYGSTGDIGNVRRHSAPRLPQGDNPVSTYIPVARIADMLLNPGEAYDYNGSVLTYPDIKLVYWCGGNPFHHHQDLARLRRAFARPDTVVVHDPFWTASARHADIVIPSTMAVERDDIGAGSNDPVLFAMPRVTEPHAGARDDYRTFADLASRLGLGSEFSQGRDTGDWLRAMYESWQRGLAKDGYEVPDFDAFWAAGSVQIPVPRLEQTLLESFRSDPEQHRLPTPSGRIEIFSATVDGFGYDDCPGHPMWLPPSEPVSRAGHGFPLRLVANQPKTRLHSQLDMGGHSQRSKIGGREPVRIHPEDAKARGIGDGQIVRIFNDTGSCLAGARLSENVARGVLQLSTGAWYDPDPDDPSFCRHGNPNVLIQDRPSSSLSQGTTGQLAAVEVEPYAGVPAAVSVLESPGGA